MWEKSLAQKLLMKAGYKVLFINAPDEYESLLGKLPDGVDILLNTVPGIDLIQVFLTTQAELETHLKVLPPLLKPTGVFWVSYPQNSTKITADITRHSISSYAASIGLQGMEMIAIDKNWSALRLKIV